MERSGKLAVGLIMASAVLLGACFGSGDDDATRGPSPSATTGVTTTATDPVVAPDDTQTPGDPATPTPEGPRMPPPIRLVDAFPRLPDLNRPIELLELPPRGTTYLLAMQDGRIVTFPRDDPGPDDAAVALDISDAVSRDGNEEGLLGMAFEPGFEHIFLYYSVAGGERRTRLARFEIEGEGTGFRILRESELVILEVPQPFSNHNGGKIAFGLDGMLYLGLGDGGSAGDPLGNGQNPGTLLGSILRIDVSEASPEEPYRIPADNPFVGEEGARGEIWAYGLRNPWRFTIESMPGPSGTSRSLIIAGDVGQGQFEEIDLIEPGQNYGWNVVEGNECFGGGGCETEGFTAPVAVYSHDGGHCSVTGGARYGLKAEDETLNGIYFYGDYCSGAIWAFDPAPLLDGEPVEPVQLLGGGPQVAAFAQTTGTLYVLSFDGRIYEIVAAGGS